MMIPPKISIIIPARNEEKIIVKTLKDLKSKVKIPHEIIVIDDCSFDKTKEIVSLYIKKNSNVRLLNTTSKRNGFSNAIIKGIKNAKTNFIVIVMADLCDDSKTINTMYEEILTGWDIVCGCRYMKNGKKIGGPTIQNFFSALVCKSLYYLIGIPTKDASNAFKMFRRSLFENLQYKANSGVEASLDFTIRAYFKKLSMVDVPTTWIGRKVGISKFKLIERSPRYIKIYLWALLVSLRRLL